MNLFKRIFISIKRNLGKSLIIFLIVFLLGILTSGAISVVNAIQLTRDNLRRQIPAVATINPDMEAISNYRETYGTVPTQDMLESTLLESIGELPYVRAFDYALISDNGGASGFFSESLSLSTDVSLYAQLWSHHERETIEELFKNNLQRMQLGVEGLEQFRIKGVRNPAIVDVEEGIIELVEGRVFTEREMDEGALVVLVSQAFATENDLVIGDTFILKQRIYEHEVFFLGGLLIPEEIFIPQNLVSSIDVELKIIGLFEPSMVMDDEATGTNIFNHMELNALIYVPVDVVRRQVSSFHLHQLEINSEVFDHIQSTLYAYQDIIFVLYDGLELEAFYVAASELLPDFWQVSDLRYEYEAMTGVLDSFQDISTFILALMVIASLTILGLLILLLIRDRRYEFGVYLALGESRIRIIVQLFIEILIISLGAIVSALSIGHLLARTLTFNILYRDLINNPDVFPMGDIIMPNDFNRMGFGVQMTAEEMVAAYDISLGFSMIILFLVVSMLMILLSTILPMIYLIRLQPKEIIESNRT